MDQQNRSSEVATFNSAHIDFKDSITEKEKGTDELGEALNERMKTALSRLGRDIDSLSDEEWSAIRYLVDPWYARHEPDEAHEIPSGSELSEIIAALNEGGLLDRYAKHNAEITELKTEHLVEIREEASRTFREFTKKLNYGAILQIEDYQPRVNQNRLLSQDLRAIASYEAYLAHPPEEESPEDQYDSAVRMLAFVQDFLEKAEAQKIDVLHTTEQEVPSQERVVEAQELVRAVPEIIEGINFHNDLQGFLVSDILQEDVRVPRLLYNIDMAQRDFDLAQNPYALVAIAQRVKDLQDSLGQLHVRTAWQDALTVDKLYELIERRESHQGNPEAEATAVDEILDRYEQQVGRAVGGRLKSEAIAKEEYFSSLLVEIVKENQPMLPVDERLLRSQLLSLHYLFSGDGIAKLYEQYVAKAGSVSQTIEDERRIKAELTLQFLRRQAKKDKEEIFLGDPNTTTIGFEYEYTEELEGLIFGEDDLIEGQGKAKAFLESIKEAPDSPEKEQIIGRLEIYIQNIEREIEARHLLIVGAKQADEQTLATAQRHLFKAPTMNVIMSRVGAFEEEQIYGYREDISAPSSYYRMQQRELVQTLLTANTPDVHLNMHITAGNIELSPKHPEAAEIHPILESAGYLHQGYNQEQIDTVHGGGILGNENYWKCTSFYGELYYLPNYFVRRGGEMVRYNTNAQPLGYELRSFTSQFGDADRFINRVRAISLTDLINKAIKADQMDEYAQRDNHKEMAALWHEFHEAWKQILADVGIEYVPLGQRFIKVEIIEGADGERTLNYLTPDRATHFSDRVSIEADQNEEFRTKVRSLITDFSHKMRLQLGVKRSTGASEATQEVAA